MAQTNGNGQIVETGFSGSTVVLALLGGAVAGAAVALLTAPKTGRETRAMIADKTRDVRDKITDTINDGREKARNLPGAAKAAGSAARTAFVEAMEVTA
jgi:gas vesicle protein